MQLPSPLQTTWQQWGSNRRTSLQQVIRAGVDIIFASMPARGFRVNFDTGKSEAMPALPLDSTGRENKLQLFKGSITQCRFNINGYNL